jgi:hypothetical protein
MLLHISLMEEILAGCIWSLPCFCFPQMRIHCHHFAGNILPACRRSQISRRTSIYLSDSVFNCNGCVRKGILIYTDVLGMRLDSFLHHYRRSESFTTWKLSHNSAFCVFGVYTFRCRRTERFCARPEEYFRKSNSSPWNPNYKEPRGYKFPELSWCSLTISRQYHHHHHKKTCTKQSLEILKNKNQ